jgi:hypothetical protein
MKAGVQIPERMLMPSPEFAELYAAKVAQGRERLASSSIVVVGLARNCAVPLASNLSKLLAVGSMCRDWRVHVETNDNSDATAELLEHFCREHPRGSYRNQTLARPQLPGEFSGSRTIALAEYRSDCQQWVRDHAADADYVFVVDFDAWGGFWIDGVLNGVGWMVELQAAYAMASVSLIEAPQMALDKDGNPSTHSAFCHYDAWALRGVGQPGTYWDDYTRHQGTWKHQWLPPVGSEPVRVASAFGGFAIYRTAAYLSGKYDGASDCEHVTFHRSIAEATGEHMYLCPGMRTVMRWMEPDDGSG